MTKEETDLIGEAIDFYNLNHFKGEKTKKQLVGLKKRIKALNIGFVSNCNAKKDTNIENTILLIGRKDGLTDVYDNSGCLGEGLDAKGINDLNIT